MKLAQLQEDVIPFPSNPNDVIYKFERKYGKAEDTPTDKLRKRNLTIISDILERYLPKKFGNANRPTESRGLVRYTFSSPDSVEQLKQQLEFPFKLIKKLVPGVISTSVELYSRAKDTPPPTDWRGDARIVLINVDPSGFGRMTDKGFLGAVKKAREKGPLF